MRQRSARAFSTLAWLRPKRSSAAESSSASTSLKTERGAERVGGGRLAELAGGGELGGRLDDPRHDHGEDQPGPALRPLRQDPVEPEPAHRSERGGDMAVRQRASDLEALGRDRRESLPGQHPTQAVDLGLRPVGEVGEGARPDLAPSRSLSRTRTAGGESRFGMRVTSMISLNMAVRLCQRPIYMPTLLPQISANPHKPLPDRLTPLGRSG